MSNATKGARRNGRIVRNGLKAEAMLRAILAICDPVAVRGDSLSEQNINTIHVLALEALDALGSEENISSAAA